MSAPKHVAAEFPFAGLAGAELRCAADALNGCLTSAIQIHKDLDVRKAVLLEAIRVAVMERIAMADVVIAHGSAKKDS
jgi:hypothetical protein